ncbi:MAG TPA: hypothetical protein VM187_07725 [Niastella sp.]|nr:hypothetical protein [Niastella sp.]
MKKLFLVLVVGASLVACGPSTGDASNNDIDVISSPTGDTAITDGGTGAGKGAEGRTDTTGTGSGSGSDSTARP